MRFSRSFIPTTKEMPKDAVLISHQLLIRGGFVSQLSAGIYDFLPLGKRVLDKVRNIVKEELDRAGCLEASLGFVTPSDLWRESGRFERYGKELLRFSDRKNQEFVLGPTHEEVMVSLVRGRVTSYKQLPINLYQINLKFRDEARPRFGLMRGREFLMKDGYSFHANETDMKREFELMEATYRRIFERLELDFRIVEADSGAIGGSGSKEFMVLADAGEDTIVVCGGCEYAANIEAAKREPKKVEKKQIEAGKIHTPNITTIDDLAGFLGISPDQTIKAVAKKALFDKGEKIALFFIRGSDQLELTKALNAVKANDLVDVTDEELQEAGIEAGFVGLGFASDQVLIRVDQELLNETDMVTGANEKDYHIAGFEVTDQLEFADLIAVEEGDICPHCGGVLGYKKGIEVGHIFQLGTRYSEPLGANFLDENGKSKPFVMGTYGIGVSRLLSASLEQFADSKGAVWQKSIAPYMVDLIVGNLKDSDQQALSEELYQKLVDWEVEVIFDDRPSGFGFKMSDFELIGFPYALIVGKKAKDGLVEVVVRKTNERIEMSPEQAIDYLVNRCR